MPQREGLLIWWAQAVRSRKLASAVALETRSGKQGTVDSVEDDKGGAGGGRSMYSQESEFF